MRKNIKAMLTVESSWIISMTVIISVFMISLCMYKYQLCWYTQAMSECLLTESNQCLLSEMNSSDLVRQKWKEIEAGNYLKLRTCSEIVDVNENSIYMELTGKTVLWGDDFLEINIQQEMNLVKPVEFIRKIATVTEVVKE